MALATSRIYEYSSVGNKAPLILPAGYKRCNISLEPTASVAKIQHTFYPKQVVEVDASLATWYDWPDGEVSVNTEASIVGAPTAFRVVVVSGSNVKMAVNFTND